MSFVKDTPIKEIRIKPNETIMKGISDSTGKEGYGYILATPKAIEVGNKVGDLAYKLFQLSGSNKPLYKIGWEKLMKQLKIEKQDISKQGRPRIQRRIENALDELKTIEHLEYWTYDKDKEMFTWKYGKEFYRHKDGVLE